MSIPKKGNPMRRAAIVSPLRTPIGGFGGTLRPLSADQLAVAVIQALLERSAIDPGRIDEVIVAQSYASSDAACRSRFRDIRSTGAAGRACRQSSTQA
jgi:acetyl-CoA C-acetyltransferase